jgi:hypothetical protein
LQLVCLLLLLLLERVCASWVRVAFLGDAAAFLRSTTFLGDTTAVGCGIALSGFLRFWRRCFLDERGGTDALEGEERPLSYHCSHGSAVPVVYGPRYLVGPRMLLRSSTRGCPGACVDDEATTAVLRASSFCFRLSNCDRFNMAREDSPHNRMLCLCIRQNWLSPSETEDRRGSNK